MSNVKKVAIRKILIANRGEISLRIMKTCQAMGIKTISIYTSEEKNLPHALYSDEAYCMGNGSLQETYLNQDLIIKIAKELGADAIHPGYGFLSENALFAEEVEESGLVFIGPKSESMKIMGDKKGSKEHMQKLGIPLIPGYHGDNQDPTFLLNEASKIGYPVLIKASAGGGGKGMRVVENADLFMDSLESAKREAANSFKNDIVLIEKYINKPRHIEVQVMSDQYGNHLHYFERECSIQRRHQKIIEECPSPNMSDALRSKMTTTAIDITSGINYLGAGTIEFIVDSNNDYYFLEMNTRLQVEHPVTEYVCCVDLVKMQIKAASGEEFLEKQKDIKMKGHAIELRIYSEDPDNNFMPVIGALGKVLKPTASFSRLDCGYQTGNEVSINFDPMLGKLITWGENRSEAISKQLASINEIGFTKIITNREYLIRILKHTQFIKGHIDTFFIEEYKDDLLPEKLSDDTIAQFIAGFELIGTTNYNIDQLKKSGTNRIWSKVHGPKNKNNSKLIIENEEILYQIVNLNCSLVSLSYKNKSYEYELVQTLKDGGIISSSAQTLKKDYIIRDRDYLQINGLGKKIKRSSRNSSDDDNLLTGKMISPMPGKIVKILAKVGDHVKVGDNLIIMEAMKMEHTIKANEDGIISKVFYKELEQVDGAVELIKIQSDGLKC